MSNSPINISIIGLGLIGGSIAKALKNSGKNFIINAFDKPHVLSSAIEEKVIDSKLEKIEETKNSGIIFLCLPTDLSLKTLKQLASLISENTIITDVCGVKGIFEKEWKSLKSKGTYIGGHPMTGKEAGGFENSDHLLFENSVYIISESEKNPDKLKKLTNIIKLLGTRIRFLDPFLHDKIIAQVSHLPQLLAVTLVNSISKNDNDVNYLDFAAGGFRDMTRIASGNFDIWAPVVKMNRQEIISSLKSINTQLKQLEDLIVNENLDSLKELFDKARAKRDEIPKNTKGFINPLYDVFVYVKDEPGVLSKLTTALFENSINIKDMELLKIREGTGGTFRISFQSKEDAEKAEAIINKAGFTTKL
jgi:prephenate dehydrogenase